MQFYGKPDKRNFGFNPWLAMPVYSSLTTKRQKSNIFALQDIERFPFDRKSWIFQNGDKWYGNFLGKVSRKSGNYWISVKRTIQPETSKILGEKSNSTVIPGKKFANISEYLARLSSFPEIPKMPFHSSLEISGSSNFSWNRKRSFSFVNKQTTFCEAFWLGAAAATAGLSEPCKTTKCTAMAVP